MRGPEEQLRCQQARKVVVCLGYIALFQSKYRAGRYSWFRLGTPVINSTARGPASGLYHTDLHLCCQPQDSADLFGKFLAMRKLRHSGPSSDKEKEANDRELRKKQDE